MIAIVAALTLATAALQTEPPAVTGDAVAGLVSTTSKGEVHVLTERRLNNKRLVLKVVVLNRSGAVQSFGPDAVTVSADDPAVHVASSAELRGSTSSRGVVSETSQGRAAPPLTVNGAGQTDVTGFTGGSAGNVGGVPTDTINRATHTGDDAGAAIEAALLKPISLRPNSADGGALLTSQLKRGTRQVTVSVTFAGEMHRFLVQVPR